jgi:hypothetical protein
LSKGSLLGVVGGKNNISLSSIGLLFSYNNSVGSLGNIAVNVASKVNFGDISCGESNGLIRERREVAGNLVNGDAARESNTSFKLLGLFVREDFLELFFHQFINSHADGVDVSSDNGHLNSLFESKVGDFSSCFVLVENSGHLNEGGVGVDLLLFRGFYH